MKDEIDKYAGIITALAFLVVVFYADGNYDLWDVFLGFVGLIFVVKLIPHVKKEEFFMTFLVSSVVSLSITSLLFSGLQLWKSAVEFASQNWYMQSFSIFGIITLVLTLTLHLRSVKANNASEATACSRASS
ncbi:hypothetical protein [Cerasicoccus frondis]|uniref:hypothetical protein n=1 Tax=Cerasicoccus frondis TaxID=490090 RepID=UPI002852BEA6|nr:hypothetical protein [Cerasicoccus frondis]